MIMIVFGGDGGPMAHSLSSIDLFAIRSNNHTSTNSIDAEI